EALPGVQSASLSTIRPLNSAARSDPFAIEGRPLDPDNLTSAGWQMVGANYFRTLGIPLEQGRDLTARDTDESAPIVAVINETVAPRKFNMLLFGLFAAIAVVLTTLGIYGVISYAVTQRTQEIGIRLALGAQAPDVMKLVLRGGLRLALIGVAIGLAGAFTLT